MAGSSNGALRDWDAELDAYLADLAAEPIIFGFAGETWRVPRPLPLGPLVDLSRAVQRGGDAAAVAWWQFVPSLLDAEEGARLEATMRRVRLDYAFVERLGQWVLEQGLGRPTSGREDSSTPSSGKRPYSKRPASQLAVSGSVTSAPEKP